MADNNNASANPSPAANPQPQVRLNTGNLKSTYCNMCNGNTTKEEVVLNFGVNQNWDRGQGDLEVALEHRIVLSPFAAKRLTQMLNQLMGEYESRYGELK
jgi:hypothetical protein